MSRTSTVANRKNAPKQATAGQPVDEEAHLQMIATAAYFRAERRGFDGVDTATDWLAAEEEIDVMPKNRKDINLH